MLDTQPDSHSSEEHHDPINMDEFAAALKTLHKPRLAEGEVQEITQAAESDIPLIEENPTVPGEAESKLEIVQFYIDLGKRIIAVSVVCLLLAGGYRILSGPVENIRIYSTHTDFTRENLNLLEPDRGVFSQKFDLSQYLKPGQNLLSRTQPFGNSIYLNIDEYRGSFGTLARFDLLTHQITEMDLDDIQFIDVNMPAEQLLVTQRNPDEIQPDGSQAFTYTSFIYSLADEKKIFDFGFKLIPTFGNWWSKDFTTFIEEGDDQIYIADFQTGQKIATGISRFDIGPSTTLGPDRKTLYFEEYDSNNYPVIFSINIETKERTLISPGENIQMSPDGRFMLISAQTPHVIILNLETQEKNVIGNAQFPFWIDRTTFAYYDEQKKVHFYEVK